MVNIDNLFKIIAEKGITQSKLAEDTSISTGNISDWKKGKSMPSAIKLDELATYFDCSVDYLLGRTDKPTKPTNNVSVNNPQNFSGTQNNGIIQTSTERTSSDDEQLFEMIKSLNLVERSKIIVMIDEMRKGA